MDSFVLAVREDVGGYFVGFLEDNEILACRECRGRTEYRLRYTENEEGNLVAHRQMAQRKIEAEHPQHSDKIRVD
jgi:hypothetical protein